MGRSELPIPMNEYLSPKYKIQVPYMNYPKFMGKHSAVCSKKYSELVFR